MYPNQPQAYGQQSQGNYEDPIKKYGPTAGILAGTTGAGYVAGGKIGKNYVTSAIGNRLDRVSNAAKKINPASRFAEKHIGKLNSIASDAANAISKGKKAGGKVGALAGLAGGAYLMGSHLMNKRKDNSPGRTIQINLPRGASEGHAIDKQASQDEVFSPNWAALMGGGGALIGGRKGILGAANKAIADMPLGAFTRGGLTKTDSVRNLLKMLKQAPPIPYNLVSNAALKGMVKGGLVGGLGGLLLKNLLFQKKEGSVNQKFNKEAMAVSPTMASILKALPLIGTSAGLAAVAMKNSKQQGEIEQLKAFLQQSSNNNQILAQQLANGFRERTLSNQLASPAGVPRRDGSGAGMQANFNRGGCITESVDLPHLNM